MISNRITKKGLYKCNVYVQIEESSLKYGLENFPIFFSLCLKLVPQQCVHKHYICRAFLWFYRYHWDDRRWNYISLMWKYSLCRWDWIRIYRSRVNCTERQVTRGPDIRITYKIYPYRYMFPLSYMFFVRIYRK